MRIDLIICLACSVLWGQSTNASESRELSGPVTRIVDGDTLEIRSADDNTVSIRLAQIDAPEKAQPYGGQATRALSALTLGKLVRVEVVDLDRYGRTVGELYLGDLHVNAEMVRQGHAWAYTRYVESLAIISLEGEARTHERGLWTLPLEQREPPWVWRHRRRDAKRSDHEGGTPDTTCGAKRTCAEMVNCAEARFYLAECGVTRLDGDGDGIPCESKCRQ
jgi:endonuclease YncB( thermonuclease family)